MDGQGTFTVLHAMRKGHELRVDFNKALYARRPHSDPAIEAAVASRWAAARAKNRSLFNAQKFRYAGLRFQRSTIVLQLGLTDYATFVGTHGASGALQTFGMHSLALPLGNAVVCVTIDDYVPFLRRSHNVAEGVGRAVFPGGHPEPQEIQLLSDATVRDELWAAARREAMEELYLKDDQTSSTQCVGLVARANDFKVCHIFSMRIRATAKQVRQQYIKGNAMQEESDVLIFKHVTELRSIRQLQCVDGLRLMPEHLGALHLWLDSRVQADVGSLV